MCARLWHALMRALNDAKSYAQQGCAKQYSGITLNNKDLKGPASAFDGQLNQQSFAYYSLAFFKVVILRS